MADTATPTAPRVFKRSELEERTLLFAADVRNFVRKLPRAVAGSPDMQQLLQASGAIGAGYIAANEASSKKEFVMSIRQCLKTSKECSFWLRLADVGSSDALSEQQKELAGEARALMRIFFAILRKIRLKEKERALANADAA